MPVPFEQADSKYGRYPLQWIEKPVWAGVVFLRYNLLQCAVVRDSAATIYLAEFRSAAPACVATGAAGCSRLQTPCSRKEPRHHA